MTKIEMIQEYVDRCDEAIVAGKIEDAHKLQIEIIGVYEDEINNLRGMLDNYSMAALYSIDRQFDLLADLRLLRQKLKNYALNLQAEQERRNHELEIARLTRNDTFAPGEDSPEQSPADNEDLTIDQIERRIEEIPDNKLSAEDKEILKEHLYSLEGSKGTKDKYKTWDKTKKVLTFVVSKGADAAIAMFPYLADLLSQ